MRKPLWSWGDEVLARFGLVRRRSTKNEQRKAQRRRALKFESLEPREMLASDLMASAFRPHENGLVVSYDVFQEDAQAFDVGIYRTIDGQTPVELLATHRVSDAEALSVGSHELGIAPQFTGVSSGDQLLVRLDVQNEVGEVDETNNQSLYTGEIIVGLDGRVYLGGEGAARIADNSQTDYSEAGSGWTAYSSSGAYQGGFRYHSAGDGSNTATWTFESLDSTKRYQAFATWNVFSNRASNAPFTVFDDTTALTTVRLSQQGAPNDVAVDGRGWESLGVYQVTSGRLQIQLNDDANGFVNADAIRLVEVPPVTEPVSLIDDGDAAYAETGSNWLGQANAGAHDGDFRYHSAGTGQNAVTWTFDVLDPSKQYRILATWNVLSNRASNAPYTISDGTTDLATVRVTQQALPNDVELDGRSWESLGVFQTASGRLQVTLTDDANGFVNADAIRLVEVLPATAPADVIDDGDATYSETGTNWLGLGNAAAHGGDLRYHSAGTGENAALWTFDLLDPTKQYRVLTTWNVYSNRASNAPFTIYDDATALATVRVNQQGAPNDVTMADRVWESLGVYQASSGRLIVKLTDDANGFVNADAIRLVEVPPVVAAPELVDDGDTAYAELGENWLGAFSSSSYQGDTRYHSAGTGSNAAQWTFASLPVGQYAVYTTWNVRSNAASNAPFTVYDGDDALATVTVNQRVVPSDITLDGLDWKGLGVFVLASGTARVQVTDLANGFVTADAVRFVCLNAAPVASGLNPVSVDEDAAPTIIDLTQAFSDDQGVQGLTFDVVSNTNAALVQTTMEAGTGQLTIAYAPNASGTAEIVIRATDAAGLYAETTLSINVAPVNDAPTTSGISDVAVIEDAAPTAIDLWSAFADVDDELTYEVVANSNSALFAGTVIDPQSGMLTLACAANAFGIASLTVRATDPAGAFVETSFTVNVTAVNDAPVVTPLLGLKRLDRASYAIARGEAIVLAAAGLDDPNGVVDRVEFFYDSNDNGVLDLGVDEVLDIGAATAEGWTLSVPSLALPLGSSRFFAQAIGNDSRRSSPVATSVYIMAAPQVVDDGAGYSELGTGWEAGDLAGGYGSDYRFHPPGSGESAGVWTVGNLEEGKRYAVYTTWIAHENRSANATYTLHDGSSPLAVERVNQRVSPGNEVIDGVTWRQLGVYTLSTDQLTIRLADAPDGYVVADAIRVVEIPPTEAPLAVVDDNTLGFSRLGAGWTYYPSDVVPYDEDMHLHNAGTGQNAATWTFDGLQEGQTYQVFATWKAHTNRATAAPFTILDGGTTLAVTSVNQRIAPVDLEYNGKLFNSLGTYSVSSGRLVVKLTDHPSGVVCADAIHLVQVTQAPASPAGIGWVEIQEDSPPTVFDLHSFFHDVDHPPSDISYTVVANTNPALLTSVVIDPALGTLTVTYAADASGIGEVTIRAADSEGLAVEGRLTLRVLPVNDAPTTTGIANVLVEEDAPPTIIDLRGSFSDIDDGGAGLLFTVVGNSNPALFSSVIVSSVEGTLVLHHAPDAHGTSTLTVRATDVAGAFVETTFDVVVAPVNDAPRCSEVVEVTTAEDAGPTHLILSGIFSDVDDPSAALTYQLRSISDPQLIALATIADGILTIHYVANSHGTASLVVRATDPAGLYAESTVSVVVTPVNDTPTTIGLPLVAVLEDIAPVSISLRDYFDDIEDGPAGLTYSIIANDRPSLAQPGIVRSSGELILTFAPNAHGTAHLTVRAEDGEGLHVDTLLTVNVASVNDAPMIEALLDSPDPAILGAGLNLRAVGVSDDGSVVSVSFYRDVDRDGIFNPAVDELIGVDVDGSDGWGLAISTAGFGSGPQRYYAIATDDDGSVSNVAHTTGNIGVAAILDDAGATYRETGTGWSGGPDGLEGHHRQHAAGIGLNTASWTFDRLVAGSHQVYVTWVPAADRASNATYRVLDNGTLVGTVQIDQRQAPDLFEDGGAWWKSLGSFDLSGGSLTVELTDAADGVVVADGVRVLDPPPEIVALTRGDFSVVRGGSVTLTAEGVTDPDNDVASVAFYRDTNGNGTLEIGADALLGVDTDGSNGWTCTFSTAALSLGNIQYFARANDVTDLQSNVVTTTGYIAMPTRIVDDGDGDLDADGIADYQETGTGWINGTQTGAYQGDYRARALDGQQNEAIWTIAGLEAGKRYAVYTTWTPNANRSSNATYSVFEGQSLLAREKVNQKLSPVGESANGVVWQRLGSYTLYGDRLIVKLVDAPDGYVVADAIRVVEIPPTEAPLAVVDDNTLEFSRLGAGWTYYPSDVVPYDEDMHLHNAGTGQNAATWTFDGLEDGARYQFYVTWKAHTNRATNAPYSIIDGDGRLLATERVNQQASPSQLSYNEKLFNLLGAYTVSGGRLTVRLSDDANGVVCADAVHLIKIARPAIAPEVVDDNDPAFSRLGEGWTIHASDPAAYGNDMALHSAGTGANAAAWTFDGLESGKRYQVLVTWKPFETRATNASYTVNFGAATDAILVNQQIAPTADMWDGRWWERLGVYAMTGSRLVVTLSDLANGEVCADAVRVVEVPPDTAPQEIIDDGDLGTSQVGTWLIGQLAGGYQGDYRALAPDGGASKVSWTFDALQAGQRYEVYATWVGAPADRATNAPFEVFSVDGDQRTSLGLVRVDQRTTPDGWFQLGTFLASHSRLVVELSADANGFVIADAIRVVPVPQRSEPLPVIDDGDADYMERGDGWQTATDRGVGNDFRYVDGDGSGNHQAVWTFDGLDPAKHYLVMATWTTHENRASNAPYQVLDAATNLGTVRVDQRRAPAGRAYDGQQWQSLGVFAASSGLMQVRLSDIGAIGRLSADAIRIVEAPQGIVIDDSSLSLGDGWTAMPDGYSLYTGVAPSTATWTFDSLAHEQRYEIYVSWNAAASRSDSVAYTVYSGGLELDTIYVDQRYSPVGPMIDGRQMQRLGIARTNSPIAITVAINGGQEVAIDGAFVMEAQDATEYTDRVFRAPGQEGQQVPTPFNWTEREAHYDNSFGIYYTDANGHVDGVAPDELGYQKKALTTSNAVPVFTSGASVPSASTIKINGGQYYSVYVVQNKDLSDYVAQSNPDQLPYAWFAIADANVDSKYDHFEINISDGVHEFRIEDLASDSSHPNPYGYINDADFDDVVITAKLGPRGDLDTDSDNNSPTGVPERSDAEEKLEDGEVGKIIAVSENPDDLDDTTRRFVPMVLEIDADVDIDTLHLQFDGDTSMLRIWRTNGSTARTEDDEIKFKQSYGADDLGLSDSTRTITLYVQAINSGKASLELQMRHGSEDDFYTADTVTFKAIDDKAGCLPCALGDNNSPTGDFEGMSHDAPGASRYSSSDSPLGSGVGESTRLWFAGNAMIVQREGETYVYDMVYSSPDPGSYTFQLRREPPKDDEVPVQNTLVWDDTSLVETDMSQTRWIFTGTGSTPGELTEVVSADGNRIERDYDGNGQLVEERQLMGGSGEDGPAQRVSTFARGNDGRVNEVTVSTFASPAVTTRVVQYSYYGKGESNGGEGDLRLVTIREGSATGAILEQKYYRYYKDGSFSGFAGAVKMILNGPSVARALNDGVSLADASDYELSFYADEYVMYSPATRKVVWRRSQGSGCSVCDTPGLSAVTYQYSESDFASSLQFAWTESLNTWKYKRTETLSDNSLIVEYYNSRRQTLLRSIEKGEDRWITWYRYDELGNVVMSANPSAVTGYDESLRDLVGYSAGASTHLRHDAGVIDVYDYYTTTDANLEYPTDGSHPATGGGVRGYLRASGVQIGDGETVYWQNEYTYVKKTVNDRAAYFTYTSTQFPNADESGAQTTTYRYQFFPGGTVAWPGSTAQVTGPVVHIQETIVPAVASAQHGSGQTSSSFVVYDTLGRAVWSKDASGVLDYTAYDRKSGAVSLRIEDVNTSSGSGFSATYLPTGWQTPAGAGKHLVSSYESDLLGRTIKSVAPTGEVTYIVYNDAQHEVRTYRGWIANSKQPTGPIEVYRTDYKGNYSESLSFSWNDANGLPVDDNGRPTGSETLADARAVIQSLSRSLMNQAGQTVATRQYSSLAGVGYSATRDLGTANSNYLETAYTYDPRGRLAVVADSEGVVRHTFFDTLGRATASWVGSGGVPNTDINGDGTIDLRDFRYWVSQNATATKVVDLGMSMHLVSANTYDLGVFGGDSNLTESRSYFGDGATDYYATHYQYDARGRMTGVLGSDGVASIQTHDNLGRTIRSQTFANCTYAAGQILTDKTLSDYTTAYDGRGQVYQSVVFAVAGSALPLTTNYWYDELGRLVKVVSPDGLIQKTIYNSLGQVKAEYVMSDATTYISVTEYVYDTAGRQIETRIGMSPGNTAAVSRTYYDADHGGANPNDDQYRVTGAASLKPGSTEFVLTAYEYDAAGRFYATIAPDPDGPALATKTTSTFDMLGRTLQTDVRELGTNKLLARSRSVYAGSRFHQSIQDEVVNGAVIGNVAVIYGYDDLGRVDRVTDPTGAYRLSTFDRMGNVVTQQSYTAGNALHDVSRNVYDAKGRLSEVMQGTTLTNAVAVARYHYDNAFNSTGTDEGRVTAVETLAPSDAAWVSTRYEYDSFGRQHAVITPDPDGAAGALLPTRTEQLYDVVGRPNLTKTWTVEDTPKLLAQSENIYTGVYLTEVRRYDVDPDTGDVGSYLATKYTYGDFGRLVKIESPTGSFTKTAYSLDGAVTAEYLGTHEGATVGLADDTIVEQTEYTYDALGNVILTASFQRHTGDTETQGELSTGNSRVSYTAAWYDSLGRITDSADYGVVSGTFSRPSTPPAYDPDEVLLSSYGYDGYGRRNMVADAKGMKTLQVFDQLGRVTYTISNYKSNAWGDYWHTTSTGEDYSRPKARASYENIVTSYQYDGLGHMVRQIVIDPKADGNEPGYDADNQVTRYIYAAELSAAANGSPVPRGDLLRAVIYPDGQLHETLVIASLNVGGGGDFVHYTYHANGAMATQTDQREVTHSYVYDHLGRLTEDRVTDLGDANERVDSRVRAIVTTYNQRGLTNSITSYDDEVTRGPANVVNQVAYAYNALNLVTQAWQAHEGPVDNDGQGVDSPSIHYAYDSLGRLTALTHPSGRVVGYSYGAAGSVDDRLSRVAAITNGDSATYAQYSYLGAHTIVGSERPNVPGGLSLSYGNADNGYNRLDKFGRVLDQIWETYGQAGEIDHFRYTYDEVSNRTSRENVVAGNQSSPVHLDETYAYDQVYRLIGTERGNLVNGLIQTPTFEQDWTLDGLGNWAAFNDDGTQQTRQTNTANEIEQITSGGTPTSLAYDAAGNLTNDGTLAYAYDAWNRQVDVARAADAAPVAAYQYDGLNRRVTKSIADSQLERPVNKTDYYYNTQWQVVESHDTAVSVPFGEDGKVTINIPGDYEWSRAIAIQPDGKAIVGGYVSIGGNTNFAVARVNLDGRLDTTFGEGDGVVDIDFNGGSDTIHAIAIQPDGKIVVVGDAYYSGYYSSFAVARLDADGLLDNSFDYDGKATVGVGGDYDIARSVAIQADGRIVVAGTSTLGNSRVALARFNTDGSLDNSFGSGGTVTEDLGSPAAGAYAVAIQTDGQIVVAGQIWISGQGENFAAVRFNSSDGTLDTTFGGGDGVADVDFAGGNDWARAMLIQPGGKIVLTGGAAVNGSRVGLVRLETDGTLDDDFGTGGKTAEFGDYGRSIAMQDDGKFLVSGYGGGIDPGFRVMRFTPTGQVDNTFDGDGVLPISFGPNGYANSSAVAVRHDRTFIVAGNVSEQGNYLLGLAGYATGEPETPYRVTNYAWDLSYIDAPLVRFSDLNGDGDTADAGETVYFTWDANQNVTAMVDAATGAVLERYVYTPYGLATAYAADWTDPHAPTSDGPLYCGYWHDAETGNYHVRNRMYDAELGAWLQRDPIGYTAGDGNLYRYVLNNPLNSTDNLGLADAKGVTIDIRVCLSKKTHKTYEKVLDEALDELKSVLTRLGFRPSVAVYHKDSYTITTSALGFTIDEHTYNTTRPANSSDAEHILSTVRTQFEGEAEPWKGFLFLVVEESPVTSSRYVGEANILLTLTTEEKKRGGKHIGLSMLHELVPHGVLGYRHGDNANWEKGIFEQLERGGARSDPRIPRGAAEELRKKYPKLPPIPSDMIYNE